MSKFRTGIETAEVWYSDPHETIEYIDVSGELPEQRQAIGGLMIEGFGDTDSLDIIMKFRNGNQAKLRLDGSKLHVDEGASYQLKGVGCVLATTVTPGHITDEFLGGSLEAAMV